MERKNRNTLFAWAVTANLALPLLSAAHFQTDSFQFSKPGVGRERIIGVCDVKDEAIVCWGPDGTPKSDLSLLVSTYFTMPGAPRMEIRYDAPAKLVVVGTLRSPGGSYLAAPSTAPTDRGDILDRAGSFNTGEGEEQVDLYWLKPKPGQTHTDLFSGYGTTVPEYPRMRVLEGSESRVGDIRVRLTKVASLPPRATTKLWRLSFSLEGPDADLMSLGVRPFAADGSVIERVDEDGRPLGVPTNTFWNGMLQVFPATRTSRTEFTSFIDPRFITEIEISTTMFHWFAFKGIALHPRAPALAHF